MQTVEAKLLEMLTNNGLRPDQSEQVFERAKSKLEVGGYKMSWKRPSSEYPDVLYAVMFLILKPITLEWIDENCPKHWARPMFTDDPMAELARLSEKGEN